jgi:hypothetical protein
MATDKNAANGRKIMTFLQATQNLISSGQSVVVAGTTTPQGQLVQKLQGMAAPYTAVDTVRDQYKQSLQVRDAQDAASSSYLAEAQKGVIALFGSTNPQLSQFGITPRKAKASLTSEQKVAAAAKSKLTRLARGTLGSRQKLSVTGTPAPKVVVSTSVQAPSVAPASVNGATSSANGAGNATAK